MEVALTLVGLLVILGSWACWSAINWVWLRPRKLEKCLRGSSYRLFYGNLKEMNTMTQQARSKPINLSDDVLPRILPFNHDIISKSGKESFIWSSPTPNIHITDPKLVREIFLKHEIFQKPKRNPLGRYLVSRMVMHEGQQWFKVRKIANPAFHFGYATQNVFKL